MRKFYLGVFLSLIAVLTINQDATGSERTDAKKFEKLLAQQSKQLKDQQKMLDAQNRQLLELQSRLDTMSDEQVVPASSKAMSKNRKNNKSVSSLSTDQPSQAAANSSQQQPQAPSGKQRLKEMPKDTKPPEIPRVSADVGGVQTPKVDLLLNLWCNIPIPNRSV